MRVITPANGRAGAVYLQIHGGGFYMDSASRSDNRNVLLADALQMAVVSIDYRVAPEHPWPAAPDDCETAALWLLERAGTEFGTTRIMIGGASAFIHAYAGHVADRTNPDISPLYGDLGGLPPTLLIVGALDILLQDSLAMAARLCAAGNEVDVRAYPESIHGFTSFPTAMATAALDGINCWIADRLDQR